MQAFKLCLAFVLMSSEMLRLLQHCQAKVQGASFCRFMSSASSGFGLECTNDRTQVMPRIAALHARVSNKKKNRVLKGCSCIKHLQE